MARLVRAVALLSGLAAASCADDGDASSTEGSGTRGTSGGADPDSTGAPDTTQGPDPGSTGPGGSGGSGGSGSGGETTAAADGSTETGSETEGPDTGSSGTAGLDTGDSDGGTATSEGATGTGTGATGGSSGDAGGTGSTGTTGSEPCALAAIELAPADEVLWGTELVLSGADSAPSPDGAAIVTYAWEVVAPAGSTAGFIPADGVDVTFTPLVIGSYTILLNVTDDVGAESCIAAAVDVEVLPGDGIHVELVWDTPGDPDPTDVLGQDLDVHLTHPFANSGVDLDGDSENDPWFDAVFDCFWFNANPNWGSLDPFVMDDPEIAVPDSNGQGPEIATLELGEDGLTYRIGVHHWCDQGFGDSTATLRVFFNGALVCDQAQAMSPLDMWCAVDILWPTGATAECEDPKGATPWVTPDYEHPFFPCG